MKKKKQVGSEIKPIKRHQALKQFSREHHHGLLLVWKIRQGISKNIDAGRINSYLLHFFHEYLEQHFREEERILFNNTNDAQLLKKRLFEEHEQLQNKISIITEDKHNKQAAQNFAEMLEKHIRFEERELFNYLQSNLREKELQMIEASHQKIDDHSDDEWSDHFWT